MAAGWTMIGACAGLGALLACPATAQPAAEAPIRAALATWTADFNAGHADRVCDLFAPDLRYDYRGFPERGYREICDLLHRSLADPARHYRYTLDIREILPAGDIAIVRLSWTLTVTSGAAVSAVSHEPGIDVFRRQADGRWRIIRYMAYEAP